MDIPICANAAAEMASITNANTIERMDGMMRIMVPLCPFIPGLPGDALLLRVCVDGEARFRTKRTAHFVWLANGSAMTFSLEES
jgi:hypothetical protein